MSKYAVQTSVSCELTQSDIRSVVNKYGATSFGCLEQTSGAIIVFELHDRRIKFVLRLPDKNSKQFTHSSQGRRKDNVAQASWEQACRSHWRALLLCIKAKLESVESQIESFDEAFMPHIVLPEGYTIGERLGSDISYALNGKPLPPLLSGPSPKDRA